MTLTTEDVAHIAHLAKLNISDSAKTLQELNHIVKIMQQLSTCDTTNVAPLLHPPAFFLDTITNYQPMPLREDVAHDSDLRFMIPPNNEGIENLYPVPKVME